jgi:hypothetical protein
MVYAQLQPFYLPPVDYVDIGRIYGGLKDEGGNRGCRAHAEGLILSDAGETV